MQLIENACTGHGFVLVLSKSKIDITHAHILTWPSFGTRSISLLSEKKIREKKRRGSSEGSSSQGCRMSGPPPLFPGTAAPLARVRTKTSGPLLSEMGKPGGLFWKPPAPSWFIPSYALLGLAVRDLQRQGHVEMMKNDDPPIHGNQTYSCNFPRRDQKFSSRPRKFWSQQ